MFAIEPKSHAGEHPIIAQAIRLGLSAIGSDRPTGLTGKWSTLAREVRMPHSMMGGGLRVPTLDPGLKENPVHTPMRGCGGSANRFKSRFTQSIDRIITIG
jgi:hypothetical protein